MFDTKIFKNGLFPMGNPLISKEQIAYALKQIKKQPNTQYIDAKGRTIMHAIVLLNDVEIVKKFPEIDTNIVDKFGYRAYDYALDACCYNVVDFLLQQEHDKKCNNYSTNDEYKPLRLNVHQLCGYDYKIWGDKLLKTVKVLIKWDPKCLFRLDSVYNGTPLFWADRANKGAEPNDLMTYLEEEMINKLTSGEYTEETVPPRLLTEEENIPGATTGNDGVAIVDNYKLSTTIKALIDEGNEAEKEQLKKQINDLNQDLKNYDDELFKCKQEKLLLSEELKKNKSVLAQIKERAEMDKSIRLEAIDQLEKLRPLLNQM